MTRFRLTLLLVVLAALPFVLAACGKGGGGY
jgi:predicted small secreted protein